ncbi:sialidase family protein [Pelagovum pacificum]|uniref:Glycosyl hydrolase n=1 Tax=Pelagovum pacificum TaxID=2588711 RepID=A0A5C5G9U7_9RHOB|nr:exo-alpha-sialidase [Pelagovum pacificum]QQA42462.1 exo-alpha-sialidase [Pelagovum pacificum]TNY31545.1 glycosyl hydrolase [Pelagovum pacificum]
MTKIGEYPRRDGLMRESDAGRLDGFLPTAAASTHASFLLTQENGDIGCLWFAGSQEGKPDVSIWFSSLPKGADQWTEEVKISDDPERSEQNPVLYEDGNELVAIWTAQHFGNQDTAFVRQRRSTDGGKSWGDIEVMFDKAGTFIRSPLVKIDAGRWLLPIFHCNPIDGERWTGRMDTSVVAISDDAGKSWAENPVDASLGLVHMCIVPTGDELLGLFRSRWADAIYACHSTDGGRSWTKPEPTDLPNNNSSIMARPLSNGGIALVFNDIRADETTPRRQDLYDDVEEGKTGAPPPADVQRTVWGTPRAPMTLAISTDGGKSWKKRDIETGPGWCLTNDPAYESQPNSELSYPSVTEMPDGDLLVTYTWHRKAIRAVRLSPEWIDG